MRSQHDVFATQGLFIEALGGEFTPPTDPLHRTHRLSRLALGVAQKGRAYIDSIGHEYPEGRVYTPSWANRSVAELWLPEDGEPFGRQLIIGEDYGSYPREILFTYEPTRMAGIETKDYLVVRDTRNQDEEVHHISSLGPEMDNTRNMIAERAQDFYDKLKPNK